MPPTTTNRTGLTLVFGAYVLWGLLPVYFPLLEPSSPLEIIAHRVVWSLVVCALLLAVTRTWRSVRALDRRSLGLLALAGVLVAGNWTTYVVGVLSGRTVDAALGYYINPLVTVVLAVVVLRERLRRAQWVAVGLGTAAVVVITAGVGELPWIALVLAVTFGLYGLIKNRVGRSVPAVTSLAVETAFLTPAALAYLLWLGAVGQGTFGAVGTGHALALASAGLVTAIPLLLFGGAARRLPLSVIGLLQYLAPTLQFAIGVLVFGEAMPAARWWGFGLAWVAVVVLTVDGLRHGRTQRLARRQQVAIDGQTTSAVTTERP